MTTSSPLPPPISSHTTKLRVPSATRISPTPQERPKALVLDPTVSRPRMVSGSFGAESSSESSDHRRACGQTKSAAKLTSAARSVAQPGQRRTLEALRQPDRTRGVPSNLSSWSGGVRWTLSSRSDHSDSTTRATAVVPASSKHTPSLSQSAYIQFSDLYCMAQPQHCRGVTAAEERMSGAFSCVSDAFATRPGAAPPWPGRGVMG